jgi:hypothetical protein
VSLVAPFHPGGGLLARVIARQSTPQLSEYGFLVGRFIDEATLARATAIAARWGVQPHEVMIANGWLDAEDYYRVLAERRGTVQGQADRRRRGANRERNAAPKFGKGRAQGTSSRRQLCVRARSAVAERAARDVGAAVAL